MAKPANLFGNIILLPCNKYSEKGTLYHTFTNTVSLAEEYTEQHICEANNFFTRSNTGYLKNVSHFSRGGKVVARCLVHQQHRR